ncbi:MAG: DMT family transporter [Proteobacteria bacterium]|nr:DMT family transporter [Pseudomonadota bacterium]
MARNLRTTAIGWMLLTGLLFIAVTGIVRHLGSDLPAVQAAFVRYAIGLGFMLPFLYRTLRTRLIPRRIGLHVLRGVVHGGGVILWFFAMARIPIAEVTAIGFTAPLFTTIGAVLFLGETLRARRIAAVIAGFLGTVIILRPGIEAIHVGALAQLAAAPLFACSFVVAKKLTETESGSVIVAWLSVFVTLVLLPPALLVWRTPTMEELLWLTAVAACATAGHYTLTRAMRLAELTMLQPFMFLQLVWASLLGFAAFGEVPDVWTWVGGAVIVAAATYIAHREALARRAHRQA